jgi:hypothetical protein
VRAVLGLVVLSVTACSSLLGIQDPVGRSDGGVDSPDAPPSGDVLKLSLTDVKLAQRQFVRVRVERVTLAGVKTDVTSTATLTSSAPTIATTGVGVITGAAKAGVATVTASLDDAATAVMSVAVSAVACHPVINELRTEGPASSDDEWVELYNPCVDAVEMVTWTLNYRSGTGTTGSDTPLATLSGSFEPGGLRLYAGPDYPGVNADARWNSGRMGGVSGSVGLRAGPITTGPLVDAVGYGITGDHPFVENVAASGLSDAVVAARKPFDGNDTGDNSLDFVPSATATPRAPNVP